MKKLLIMASLFWPQKNGGGPPVSIMNVVKALKDDFDIYIISKNHELNDDKPLEGILPGWNQFDFGKAYYVPKGEHTFKKITSLIEEVSPDVIYQNSFFSADDVLPVLAYKKKHKNVKIVIAPRGEVRPIRINFKKIVYTKILRYTGLLKDVYFQGLAEEECEQEEKFLKIPADRILNIPNLSIVSDKGGKVLKKTSGSIKFVYIARVHPVKNTLKAIEWLGQTHGDVQYDIYGSIEDVTYWKQCEEAIAKLPNNVTVNYKGVIDHSLVAETITKYHAFLMPTTGEGFGHSIVETMLMGRPVVISDQTPWTDVNGRGGYAIPLDNEEDFINAMNELIATDEGEYQRMCCEIEQYIKEKLNIEQIRKRYIEAFSV